jgi:hypothetical protein
MGMTWLSMWYRLVLTYQPVVWIELELNPSGWRCVGEAAMANTHKAKEGAPGGLVVVNTSDETSVGTLHAKGSHSNAF